VVRFRAASACLLAGLLGVATLAHAEGEPGTDETPDAAAEAPAPATPAPTSTQALRVVYAAPAGCGSRASFVSELEARTPRVRVVESGDAVAIVSVELADRPTGIVGQLSLREPDGSETRRAVAGKSCEEVVPALALIAAVLLDPEAMTRPAPAAPPARDVDASTGVRAPNDELRFRPSLGTGAAVTSTVAPSLSIAPALELGLEMERGGRRGPMLSVSLERFSSSTVTTHAGLADFSTLLARVSVCPLRWPERGLAFLAPCGAFEAGSLHVDVSHSIDEKEPTVLWLGAGPGLHFELRPLKVLGVELDLLGIFPLVRDTFYFSPQIAVFSIPVVGWTGRIGVKAVWP